MLNFLTINVSLIASPPLLPPLLLQIGDNILSLALNKNSHSGCPECYSPRSEEGHSQIYGAETAARGRSETYRLVRAFTNRNPHKKIIIYIFFILFPLYFSGDMFGELTILYFKAKNLKMTQ